MKLFSTGKTAMYLDSILHKNEKRKGGEAKVVELVLRIQPFTSQLALAMDEIVKTALFKRTSGEPVNHVKSLDFSLPVPRQQMSVFASPDTDSASILFDQVKITGIRARTEKGLDGYGCVVKCTFGPVDKRELEFVEGWRGTMKFCSFDEAEPNLDFEEGEPDEDDDEEQAAAGRPAPMFEDPRDQTQPQSVGAAAAAKPAKERTQRKNISHAKGKGKKK